MKTSVVKQKTLDRLDNSRVNLLDSTKLTPRDLQTASDEELLQLQKLLLMGNRWGVMEYPEGWSYGTYGQKAKRQFRLELALPAGITVDSATACRIWRELLRLAVATRLWPARMGGLIKPTTSLAMIRGLGFVIREFGAAADGPFWGRYRQAEVRKRFGKTFAAHTSNVAHFHVMGALPDGPTTSKAKGVQSSRDRTGEAEHCQREDTSKLWQPFPDGYTFAAGWRAAYVVREVGPTLLDALEHVASLPLRVTSVRGKPLTKRRISEVNRSMLTDVIAGWDWRDAGGHPLLALPMQIHLKKPGRPGELVHWPPRDDSEAWQWLEVLQPSHLWLTGLSLGARHGEIVAMHEACLRRESSTTPTAGFVTWKLDGVLGRQNEAPLPEVVVATLKQQIRLARLVKNRHGVQGDHLWVRTCISGVGVGEATIEFTHFLTRFNGVFQLDALMECSRIHMHRFRKTLVRIVALALVHAPKILMDILGHRDEQMTVMRYILSDPGIFTEIEQITRELVILKGLEAVNKIDDLQGSAAPKFRERVSQYAKLMGKNALEPQNLREFIEVMTEGGGGWAIIGPGKVCTGFRKGGLCNDSQGEANPHYCDPSCPNQLLFPEYEGNDGVLVSAIVEAIETIDYMVDQLRMSDGASEDMLAAQFAGQISALLRQWREVDRHFRENHSNNPVIKKYLPKIVLLL